MNATQSILRSFVGEDTLAFTHDAWRIPTKRLFSQEFSPFLFYHFALYVQYFVKKETTLLKYILCIHCYIYIRLWSMRAKGLGLGCDVGYIRR
jgi:hypothetical protein